MGRKKKRIRLAVRQQKAAAAASAAAESAPVVVEEKAPVEEPLKPAVDSKISKIVKKRKTGKAPSTKKK